MPLSNQNMFRSVLKQSVRDSELTGHPVLIQPTYSWLAGTFPAMLLYYPDSSAAQSSKCQGLQVNTHISFESDEM